MASQIAPVGAAPAVNAGAESLGAQDLFPLYWPHLAVFLETPRSKDEISAAFGLVPAQVSVWIRRALSEGRVARVKGRPSRYRLKLPTGQQLHLFEWGPGYRVLAAAGSSGADAEDGGGWPGNATA